MEKAYSQIAFLPVHLHFLFLSLAFADIVLSFPCPFPFLSNMLFRLSGKCIHKLHTLPVLFLFLSLSIALLSFPFLPFPFLFLAFLSNMLFGRPGKNIFANCVPSPCFSFSIPFLCFPFLFLPFLSLK